MIRRTSTFQRHPTWLLTFRHSELTHSFLRGSFLPPKLIILIQCLSDILFFQVLFLYVKQDVNLA